MHRADLSRRRFLADASRGLPSAWLALRLPDLARMHHHLTQQPVPAWGAPGRWLFFTDPQAVEVEAMAAQILPSHDGPGAREARCIRFVDFGLAKFWPEDRPAFRTGLRQLSADVRAKYPGYTRFSRLEPNWQYEMMSAMEGSALFEMVRTYTLAGFLCNPEYGGNAGRVGWKHIGFEDRFSYRPPFGWYDRDENRPS